MRTFALVSLLLAPALAHADPANEPSPGRAPRPSLPAPPDVAAPPAHATRTASGLAYVTLTPGRSARRPTRDESAEVHYTGWQTDGHMIDSSVTRGAPATFPLRGVIEGFAEALTLMSEGQRIRVWIPEGLAYRGAPGRPAGMLVFEIELLRIEPPRAG